MDKRAPRNGRVIEELGWYDPCQDEPEKRMDLKAERIRYWLSVGAQPSETVQSLLKQAGILGEGADASTETVGAESGAETTEA
jgi:small subunit ribosomal protein S16